MKTSFVAVAFVALQFFTATARADVIKEADYPIHYEVLGGSKSDNLVIRKVCTMTLRDQANADVIISISRKRIGSCDVLPSGEAYNGRQNTDDNTIELVIPVGEDRARVERWHVDSTVKNRR
jgi:hypothetical protein